MPFSIYRKRNIQSKNKKMKSKKSFSQDQHDHEEPMISLSHTVVDPGTMMVHPIHASIAVVAVSRSLGHEQLANRAHFGEIALSQNFQYFSVSVFLEEAGVHEGEGEDEQLDEKHPGAG